ncbi:MAG: FecR domain-containing protein [Pseudomonadota bacterium]
MLSLLAPLGVQAEDWVYTFLDGDNLWAFSEKYLDRPTRAEQLQQLNNIPDALRIPPGTMIRVPMDWVPDDTPVPAWIEDVFGSASVYRASGEVQAVSGRVAIYLGDRVRCDSGASLAIRFADGSVITLHEDSELHMDSLSAYGETGMVDSRLNLLRGRAETRVRPAVGPGSRFEIETPSAISAVRGTEYRAVVAEGTSRMEVLEGTVAVAAQQQELVVDEGYGTSVAEGAAPAPPVALLPAPEPLRFDAPVADRQTEPRWARLEGADRYRIELSTDERFRTVFWQSTVAENMGTLPLLAEGVYFLRVRGIDGTGLEGLAAQAPFRVAPAPPPEPLATTVLRAGQERLLTWESAEPGSRYEVQIASDPGFRDLLETETLSTTSLKLDLSGTEERYVRARAVDAQGSPGPWGETHAVTGSPDDASLWVYLQGLGLAALLALALL